MPKQRLAYPFFRTILAVALISLVLLSAVNLVHASTFVGYNASNLGSSTCGTNCTGPAATSDPSPTQQGDGESFANPIAGGNSQVTAVALYTGNAVPTSVVILTFTGVPATTIYNNPANYVNSGQSFTVVDQEGLSGVSAQSFNTINLAAPPTIAPNQWVAVVFMQNPASLAPYMFAGTGLTSAVSDACFHFGTTTPIVGNSYTTSVSQVANCGLGPIIVGATFTPVGQGGQSVTVTQCYGNCGSPPITLVNTNSTHTVNFNNSITLLYEFQSNVNGFLLNVTTNIAKSYQSPLIQNGPIFGVYTIPSCPAGQTPFSLQCPGTLIARSTSGLFFTPPKGRATFTNLNIPVVNGQWVAIALSGFFSGLDVNDTNTNVNLFQSNEGTVPPVVQQAASIGNSKVGLWAWVRGNVITSTTPTPVSNCANNFAQLDCLLPQLVNQFCAVATAQCQTGSALIWIVILTLVFMATFLGVFHSVFPKVEIRFSEAGEIFMVLILVMTFLFSSLGLVSFAVPVLIGFALTVLVGKRVGDYF